MKDFKFLSNKPDILYIQLQDVDSGEFFGIPAAMDQRISRTAVSLHRNGRRSGGPFNYREHSYSIRNIDIYDTTLYVDILTGVYHYRQVIPYE